MLTPKYFFRGWLTFIVILFSLYQTCSAATTVAVRTATATNTPISIMLQFEKGQVSILIDSKRTPMDKVLEVLGSTIIQRTKECPVVVLMDERAPFRELINLRGIAQKAGFLNIRYFYFEPTKRMMAEFTFEHPAVPFSLRPN